MFLKHAGNVSGGDNSRLFDILQRLGIDNMLVTEYSKGDIIIESHINYTRVDQLLTAEREKSMKYVESIVNSVTL